MFVILSCYCCGILAQPRQGYSFQHYTVNRGLTSNAVKSIAEDSNGFIWLANNTAVQWFDGFVFRQLPLGNGANQLPSKTNVEINRLHDGRLLFCYATGFSVYEPAVHRFRHHKLQPAATQPVFLSQHGSRVWLAYAQEMIQYDINTFSEVRRISMPVLLRRKTFSRISSAARSHYIAFTTDGPYNVVLDTVSLQLVTHRRESKKLEPSSALCMASDTSYLEIGWNSIKYRHIHSGDVFFETKLAEPIQVEPQSYVTYSQVNPDTLIIACGRGLLSFSISKREYLSQIVAVANRPFIHAGELTEVMTDRYHNIWLSGNVEGLFRVNYSANRFRYYGGGDKSNFAISVAASKGDNRVVSGTYGQGLFVYDTTGLLLRHIPFVDPEYSHLVTVPAVTRIGTHRYLLSLYTGTDFYILNTLTYAIQRTWIRWPGKAMTAAFNYYGKIQEVDDKTYAYNTGENKVMLFTIEGNMINCRKIVEEPLIIQYANGSVLAGTTRDKQIVIQDGDKREVFEPFRQTAAINDITRTSNGIFWAATSSGLYQLGEKGRIQKQYTTTEGLSNDYIFSVTTDNEENIWCSHFKGISKISTDGRITNISAAEGLQGDEFNTGSVFKTSDGELYFGGINGINSFYPQQVSRIGELPDVVITQLSTGDKLSTADTAFWNIESIRLTPSQNTLELSFSALGKQAAEIYNYQYRLRTGSSGEWSDLRHNNRLNFSLDAGTYYVDLYAGSFFDPQAKPLKTIRVVIPQIFYRTWWFLASCGICLLLLFWQLSRWLSKKKYKKQLEQALQVQHQLEEERERISRDLHDNMGAYTSALLANVQQFKEKQQQPVEVLEKMETNADHILSSLRETIWVLNHHSVTVSDFSDGFKNYCFKILRNFEDVVFNAEEQIIADKEIPAAKAVHLNKLLQEAIQNIIKHANATAISYAIQSDQLIRITITDNGNGFEFLGLERGNGLDNMQWRAAEAGFQLFIEPVKGRGTQIRLVELDGL